MEDYDVQKCPCKRVDLPDCIQDKPMSKAVWKKWPTTLEGFVQDADCKRLHHFMTCPAAIAANQKEIQDAFIKGSKNILIDAKAMAKVKGSSVGEIVVLVAGKASQWNYYQSDTTQCVFKQEQFFRYLFAVDVPDCIGVFEVRQRKFRLFITQPSESAKPFLGELPSYEYFQDTYGFETVQDVKEFQEYIDNAAPSKIYTLDGVNSDSRVRTNDAQLFKYRDYGLSSKRIDSETLFPLLERSRAIKTKREQMFLKCAAYISSMAHCYIMSCCKPGTVELTHEAYFKAVCTIVGGARNVAYTCICASQFNNNVLHYGHEAKPNDRLMQKGDLCLHDLGGIFPCGYVADITCTFPIDGKFSVAQRNVYDIVLKANLAVQEALMPGVSFKDMHVLADRVILEGLVDLGLLKGDIDEMVKLRIGGYFMPHGLGHLVGLDVHDCGGHEGSSKDSTKGHKGIESLRCTLDLKEGMYVTVEPGVYFMPSFLEELIADDIRKEFVNVDALKSWFNAPGVRIEDDVIITKNGSENYAIVPRTTAEIESFMQLGR